jgi:DNA polymerase-3 subunit epsilon
MNTIDFVALDVETANADIGSICQIGLVAFKDGIFIREWTSLINPEEEFSAFNSNIHDLTAAHVADAPTLPEVADTLRTWLERQVVVCHTMFDQRALARSFAKYGLPELNCRWLDSCQVARQTWDSPDGHSLPVVCGLIGHEFQHHAGRCQSSRGSHTGSRTKNRIGSDSLA